MVRRSTIAAIAKSVNATAMAALQRALRETRERAERNKAEEGLRRSEMYLAEAQRLMMYDGRVKYIRAVAR